MSPAPITTSALLATDISIPLSPALVQEINSHPPFIPLPGALNLRDIGLLASSPIPAGLIYRSGDISCIPPSALVDLGVKVILDLRSEGPIAAQPSCLVEGEGEGEGVRDIHIPPIHLHTAKSICLADLRMNNGIKGGTEMYMQILQLHKPAFTYALEHIRDVGTPLLFHCTAGKDRTGVLAAVLLGLAGAEMGVVGWDYCLSRVGVELKREWLEGMMRAFVEGREGGVGRGRRGEDEGEVKRGEEGDLVEDEGRAKGAVDAWKEYVQVKEEYIMGFLEEVVRRYGSVEGWVMKELGWEEKQVARLRSVLRGEQVDM